jgi:hypothetical protein
MGRNEVSFIRSGFTHVDSLFFSFSLALSLSLSLSLSLYLSFIALSFSLSSVFLLIRERLSLYSLYLSFASPPSRPSHSVYFSSPFLRYITEHITDHHYLHSPGRKSLRTLTTVRTPISFFANLLPRRILFSFKVCVCVYIWRGGGSRQTCIYALTRNNMFVYMFVETLSKRKGAEIKREREREREREQMTLRGRGNKDAPSIFI